MTEWQWIACGKHPAARDYIRLGTQFPLGGTLFGWIEQGYEKISRDPPRQGSVLWRFWIRGTVRDQIASGLLCQSSDAIGRPYPLLLMGCGIDSGWEKSWENLPLDYEAIWHELAALVSADYRSVSELSAALGRLKKPVGIQHDDTLPPLLPVRAVEGDSDTEFALYSLEAPNGSMSATAAAMRLSLIMKKRLGSPPVAMFIGGGETAFMAAMRRPLKPQDFATLWNPRN